MSEILAVLIQCAALVAIYMTVWFVLAILRKDNSIADIAWGLGFVLVAGVTLARGAGPSARSVLASSFVFIWGMRLALHILLRNRKRGEDPRYAAWRTKWGRWFVVRSYLQVFLLQGLFLLAISYSVILINTSVSASLHPLGLLDLAGTVVWVVGFLFEAVGDAQLSRFRRDPGSRGKIINTGLWRYTRHPNYFGESLMWWGILLLALSLPYGWTAFVSPFLITFLLVRVSGIPMLEKKYAGNAEFQAYARRTSAFVPWFPRK
jgi:steroid 5-alpha reductase family enzyme